MLHGQMGNLPPPTDFQNVNDPADDLTIALRRLATPARGSLETELTESH